MDSKFKVGDKVKIVKYGAIILCASGIGTYDKFPLIRILDNDIEARDILPELIGKKAVISEVSLYLGTHCSYALNGVSKTTWYLEEQLELIEENGP